MTGGQAVFHCQTGVEQQHAALCPRLERAVDGDGLAQITLQFFENVAQGGGQLDARRHRERQALRLVRAVVGVLPQDHHFDLRQRGELQGPQRVLGVDDRASV